MVWLWLGPLFLLVCYGNNIKTKSYSLCIDVVARRLVWDSRPIVSASQPQLGNLITNATELYS